jgi:hypothetical protein
MNTMPARIAMALLILMVQQSHAQMTGGIPNTVDGMLVFHCWYSTGARRCSTWHYSAARLFY